MNDSTPDPQRWKALAVISLAQLMVLLDGTIVNIAFPRMQSDLGFSDADRQWFVTAYTLAFGALLLGGLLGDMWGRKRVFLTGLVGFALASALGGAAAGTGVLLGARALQGVFGALLAPAALSLVATTFTKGRERATAFGIFSAIAMAGSAIGLLLGGALTQYVDWRWCLYVNIVFAVVAIAGAVVFVREHGGHAGHRLDLPGAAGYQAMIKNSAAGRVGTTDEVATAAAYLLEAGFVTGSDLLIDGGVIAAMNAGRLGLSQ
ncbi:MFS transporter [Planomonospora sp. ID67723]|uniref:MFS transporter n=1 Tax=Planomonospora sp. ID67723 TaxID=2738134 RepID=UPI0018C3715F|nr:MFS transporter [Planomonospora sp. ID67723]MBG0831455.1 MFS transporter [Planomonospora sp. ID67723]